MDKSGTKIGRKSRADHRIVREREYPQNSFYWAEWVSMLMSVGKGGFVVAERTKQWGTIIEVIRDKYGTPACLKVVYEEDRGSEHCWGYDYISVNEVTEYSPTVENGLAEEFESWYYDDSWREDWGDVEYNGHEEDEE